jgi:hypothetical protein
MSPIHGSHNNHEQILQKRKNPYFPPTGFPGYRDFSPKDNKRAEKASRKLEK